MSRTVAAVTILLAGSLFISGQDTPAAKPKASSSRADELKQIQADYKAALDEFVKAVRAGKVKAAADGGYIELIEFQKRFGKRTRELIDANPKDEVALDAMLFFLLDLVPPDPKEMYDRVRAHHLASSKLASLIQRRGSGDADETFLRAAATESPHMEVRARAALALADRLARTERSKEAEPLLEKIIQDPVMAKLEHHHGDLGKAAEHLLFEIRHLSVGKIAPEVDGFDLDSKPMKLSEYRGKVVLFVFWATWCGPCMAMVPHERDLTKRYAGRPFVIVGVNGDVDEKRLKQVIQKEQITWRSFVDYQRKGKEVVKISRHCWNTDSWPTVYLIDHGGVIRHKFFGVPAKISLDAAIEKLVATAEGDAKRPGKK